MLKHCETKNVTSCLGFRLFAGITPPQVAVVAFGHCCPTLEHGKLYLDVFSY
jgi:hypothetical protein